MSSNRIAAITLSLLSGSVALTARADARATPIGRTTPRRATDPLPPRYLPGRRLFHGEFKDIFTCVGDPHALVRIVRQPGNPPHMLRDERAVLSAIGKLGIPRLKFRAVGTVEGQPADVVRWYAFALDSKDSRLSYTVDQRRTIQTAHDDMARIHDGIRAGAAVSDLALLFDPGEAVVFDSLRLILPDSPNYSFLREQNLQFLEPILHASRPR